MRFRDTTIVVRVMALVSCVLLPGAFGCSSEERAPVDEGTRVRGGPATTEQARRPEPITRQAAPETTKAAPTWSWARRPPRTPETK